MNDQKPKIDLINYSCAECGSHDWIIKIGHVDDGRTFLYVICADEDCQKQQREENGVEDNAPLIWDEFDITGQGHDPQDIGGITGEGHLN